MRSPLRTQYLGALGLTGNDADARPKLKAALTRAYQLRNFEIEHYWKRGTYFWAFQVAIFTAFGLLFRDSDAKDLSPIIFALAGLGILTAVANALAASASRFWQNNWEKHIDMLEDEFEGRLYKTVWLTRGTAISSIPKTRTISFSVSRVNQWLSYISSYFGS